MLSRIIGVLGMIGAAALSVLAALFFGRKQGRDEAKIEEQASYIEKRKELDNADLGLGDSDDDRIKRLREIAGK